MADDGATTKLATELGDHVPTELFRTVKPRVRKANPLPVIALGQEYFLAETGETGSIADLVDNLPEYAPTLFCAVGAADFVATLTSVYLLRTPDTWQWRASAHERSIVAPNQFAAATRVSTAIHFFGWQTEYNNHYHKIIDPVTLYGHSLDTIWPDEVVSDDPQWRMVTKLLKWGIVLRDFCHENGIEIRPTLGSISAQFLTDPRFYPRARRKVPAKINQRARENLPGNHYMLNVLPDPSNNFTGDYLDQHRAHHYHAQHVSLPDSDSCFAYGRFMDLDSIVFRDRNAQFMGMYCLDLSAPTVRPPFDWIGDHLDAVFVYTNELPHILDMGYSITGVRAAWGSLRRDAGLPKYAEWAGAQLDRYNDSPWLKPLLLATYGVLATRPVNAESIYRLAKKGVPVRVKTGCRELSGLRVQSPRKLEPKIAYVLQRGMIEAATRSESVGLAQYLDYLGHTVLSIYADAVIVEADDDKPLPELTNPWRCKKALNHLQFVNRQAFVSDGMTKLPGVGRELSAYRQSTMPGYAPRRARYNAVTGRRVTRKQAVELGINIDRRI